MQASSLLRSYKATIFLSSQIKLETIYILNQLIAKLIVSKKSNPNSTILPLFTVIEYIYEEWSELETCWSVKCYVVFKFWILHFTQLNFSEYYSNSNK